MKFCLILSTLLLFANSAKAQTSQEVANARFDVLIPVIGQQYLACKFSKDSKEVAEIEDVMRDKDSLKLGNAIFYGKLYGKIGYYLVSCEKNFIAEVREKFVDARIHVNKLLEEFYSKDAWEEEQKAKGLKYSCKEVKSFEFNFAEYKREHANLSKYSVEPGSYLYYIVSKDLQKHNLKHYSEQFKGDIYHYTLYDCKTLQT